MRENAVNAGEAERRCASRTGFARGCIAVCGLALLAQAIAIWGWDEALVACASVALPIGLAFVVPRIGAGRDTRVVVAEWDRRVALLFAPWPTAVLLLWSFQLMARSAPNRAADLVGGHALAYALLVAATGVVFAVAFWRAPSLRHENKLAFLAMAVLAVTAIGGFGVLAIIGLALT